MRQSVLAMTGGNIPTDSVGEIVVLNPHPAQSAFTTLLRTAISARFQARRRYTLKSRVRHAACYLPLEVFSMSIALSPLFWDKKFRIALLTLATFVALC